MNITLKTLLALLLTAGLSGAIGCKKKPAQSPAPQAVPPAATPAAPGGTQAVEVHSDARELDLDRSVFVGQELSFNAYANASMNIQWHALGQRKNKSTYMEVMGAVRTRIVDEFLGVVGSEEATITNFKGRTEPGAAWRTLPANEVAIRITRAPMLNFERTDGVRLTDLEEQALEMLFPRLEANMPTDQEIFGKAGKTRVGDVWEPDTTKLRDAMAIYTGFKVLTKNERGEMKLVARTPNIGLDGTRIAGWLRFDFDAYPGNEVLSGSTKARFVAHYPYDKKQPPTEIAMTVRTQLHGDIDLPRQGTTVRVSGQDERSVRYTELQLAETAAGRPY